MKFGIFEVPDDVAALFIFAHLSKRERLQARLVSQEFKRGLHHFTLWQKQFVAYGVREKDILELFGDHKTSFADIYMKAGRFKINKKLVEKTWVSVLLLENQELISKFFEDATKGTNWLADKTYLDYSYAPLHLCAMLGNSALIDYFLSKGMSLNAKSRIDHATPLLYAARFGRIGTLKKLVDAKAEITSTDKTGRNLADYAQDSNNEEVIAFVSSLVIIPSPAAKNVR